MVQSSQGLKGVFPPTFFEVTRFFWPFVVGFFFVAILSAVHLLLLISSSVVALCFLFFLLGALTH